MCRRLLLTTCAAALLTGCGSAALQDSPAAAPPAREPTRAYIEASQRLLQPPGEIASLVVASIGGDPSALDARAVRERVEWTRDRVAALQAVPLRDPGLRAQRTRLVGAIRDPVLLTMDRIASAAARGDANVAVREGQLLINEIKGLPSRVEG